jgi:hypothetical protein
MLVCTCNRRQTLLRLRGGSAYALHKAFDGCPALPDCALHHRHALARNLRILLCEARAAFDLRQSGRCLLGGGRLLL